MIHFACPKCSRTFRAPDGFAGKASKCPGCGTSVRVPASDPQGTTLHQDGTDEALPAPEPRRPRRPAGVPWLALSIALAGVVALAGVAVVLVAVAAMKAPAGPSAVVEGERWTPEDLVAYLRAQGADVETFPSRKTGGLYVAARNMFSAARLAELREKMPDEEYTWRGVIPGLMLVERLESASDAPPAPGIGYTHAWGRLLITGDIGNAVGVGSVYDHLRR